jgi:hypothetical protein
MAARMERDFPKATRLSILPPSDSVRPFAHLHTHRRNCDAAGTAPSSSPSLLAAAIGRDWKCKLSPTLYFAAIPLAFVNPWISNALFVLVEHIWLIPGRIERVLVKRE